MLLMQLATTAVLCLALHTTWVQGSQPQNHAHRARDTHCMSVNAGQVEPAKKRPPGLVGRASFVVGDAVPPEEEDGDASVVAAEASESIQAAESKSKHKPYHKGHHSKGHKGKGKGGGHYHSGHEAGHSKKERKGYHNDEHYGQQTHGHYANKEADKHKGGGGKSYKGSEHKKGQKGDYEKGAKGAKGKKFGHDGKYRKGHKDKGFKHKEHHDAYGNKQDDSFKKDIGKYGSSYDFEEGHYKRGKGKKHDGGKYAGGVTWDHSGGDSFSVKGSYHDDYSDIYGKYGYHGHQHDGFKKGAKGGHKKGKSHKDGQHHKHHDHKGHHSHTGPVLVSPHLQHHQVHIQNSEQNYEHQHGIQHGLQTVPNKSTALPKTNPNVETRAEASLERKQRDEIQSRQLMVYLPTQTMAVPLNTHPRPNYYGQPLRSIGLPNHDKQYLLRPQYNQPRPQYAQSDHPTQPNNQKRPPQHTPEKGPLYSPSEHVRKHHLHKRGKFLGRPRYHNKIPVRHEDEDYPDESEHKGDAAEHLSHEHNPRDQDHPDNEGHDPRGQGSPDDGVYDPRDQDSLDDGVYNPRDHGSPADENEPEEEESNKDEEILYRNYNDPSHSPRKQKNYHNANENIPRYESAPRNAYGSPGAYSQPEIQTGSYKNDGTYEDKQENTHNPSKQTNHEKNRIPSNYYKQTPTYKNEIKKHRKPAHKSDQHEIYRKPKYSQDDSDGIYMIYPNTNIKKQTDMLKHSYDRQPHLKYQNHYANPHQPPQKYQPDNAEIPEKDIHHNRPFKPTRGREYSGHPKHSDESSQNPKIHKDQHRQSYNEGGKYSDKILHRPSESHEQRHPFLQDDVTYNEGHYPQNPYDSLRYEGRPASETHKTPDYEDDSGRHERPEGNPYTKDVRESEDVPSYDPGQRGPKHKLQGNKHNQVSSEQDHQHQPEENHSHRQKKTIYSSEGAQPHRPQTEHDLPPSSGNSEPGKKYASGSSPSVSPAGPGRNVAHVLQPQATGFQGDHQAFSFDNFGNFGKSFG